MIWLVAATALAGGLGAMARFVTDGIVTAQSRLPIPLGTPAVNITGSLLLGVITGLAVGVAQTELRTILGAGFLGGYTTFSTASTQNADLLRKRHPYLALLYGAGMLAGSLSAAAAGLWIGVSL
jgi:CrcB protein